MAAAAVDCIRVWKKIAEDGGAVSSAKASGSLAPPTLPTPANSAGLSSQSSASSQGAADVPRSLPSASSGAGALPPSESLSPTRKRVRDMLRKVLFEIIAAHFSTDAGKADLATLGLIEPTPVQLGAQCDAVSTRIEAALFTGLAQGMHDTPAPAYGEQFKLLALNLRRNAPVCLNIFFGITTPTALVGMSAEEIASPAVKAELEKALKDGAEAVMLDWKVKNKTALLASAGIEAKSGMLRCPRCKGHKTDYYQLQTRSADEPMTTFANCEDCGLKWRIAG